MKKILFAIILTFCFVLICSFVYADFYVIAAGKRAKRTVLVSPKNITPDHSDNGLVLLNALGKITDASADNTYLVMIEPGVYNIGSSALQLKSYVDIQGSGENVTKITGSLDSESSGVVCGADNVEIRFLTVENTGSGTYSNGIHNFNCFPITLNNVTALASGGADTNNGIYNNYSSPSMTNVTAAASNGSNINRGIYVYDSTVIMTNVTATGSGGMHSYGFLSNASEPRMTNVTATASGGTTSNRGIYCYESSPTMNHVTATASGGAASYGIFNYNATTTIGNSTVKASGGVSSYGVYSNTSSNVTIDHSIISGTSGAVYNDSSTTHIANTRIDGGVSSVGGIVVCFGVCDQNYNGYTCP